MKKKNVFSFLCPKNIEKKGFTLAETLIALVVIGVVAAIMIPALSALIQTKAREHQVKVAKVKFNRAAEMMMLNGKMGPFYDNTYEFVGELQRHLKINTLCKVGDSPAGLPPVTACFGDDYDTITLNSKGDTYKISDIKTGAQFQLDEDDKNDWSSDNIAFMTVDGTRFLVSYNKKCQYVTPGVYEGNSSAGCVSGLVDIDGDKKPNTIGKDAYLFGSAKGIGSSCGAGDGVGICYTAPMKVQDIFSSNNYKVTVADCRANIDKYGFTEQYLCSRGDSGGYTNWFASIVEYCGGLDKLMTYDDYTKMIANIYDAPAYSVSSDKWNAFNLNKSTDSSTTSRLADFGLPSFESATLGGSSGEIKIFIYDAPLEYQYVMLPTLSSSGISTGQTWLSDSVGGDFYVFCKQE